MAAKLPKVSYWQAIKTVLPEVFRATPRNIVLDCLFMPVVTGWYVLTAVVMQHLFDMVEKAVAGNVALPDLVLMVLATGGVQILSQVIVCVSFIICQPLKIKAKGALDQGIHRKAARLSALNYEDAEILDCINKAKSGAENAITTYVSVSTLTFFYGSYLVFMGMYLHYLRPVLIWALLCVLVPLIAAQLLKGRFFSRFIDESAPLERKMDYYEKAIYHREYFKETHLLGIFTFVKGLYLDTLALFSIKRWQAAKKTYGLEIALRLLTLAGYYGVLYLLFDSLLGGHISVGAFAAVLASIGQFFSEMSWAFRFYLANMMEGIGTVKAYVQFMRLPEQPGQPVEPDYSQGITMENVSFRYPNTERDAVRNISLAIKPGETVALVGKNGAGKTTLVRLLMGILPANEGCVRLGDSLMTKIAQPELYRKTSAVFQKFQKYKMSLQDNVVISSLDTDVDAGRLDKALAEADIALDEIFNEGLDTMLSREFDGIDLSGGQWQRVSLARGLYRSSELIILDEPTSAIDPIEETRLYKKFAAISQGKMAVIVTHRLGSAKIADRIVVLDEGKIDAIGNHEQLLAANGLYANMYREQAKWYFAE